MIKYLRLSTGLKREDFANYFHIPLAAVYQSVFGENAYPSIEEKAAKYVY